MLTLAKRPRIKAQPITKYQYHISTQQKINNVKLSLQSMGMSKQDVSWLSLQAKVKAQMPVIINNL